MCGWGSRHDQANKWETVYHRNLNVIRNSHIVHSAPYHYCQYHILQEAANSAREAWLVGCEHHRERNDVCEGGIRCVHLRVETDKIQDVVETSAYLQNTSRWISRLWNENSDEQYTKFKLNWNNLRNISNTFHFRCGGDVCRQCCTAILPATGRQNPRCLFALQPYGNAGCKINRPQSSRLIVFYCFGNRTQSNSANVLVRIDYRTEPNRTNVTRSVRYMLFESR